MKNNILDILRSGKSISTPEIAELTDSTPEMVMAKLERLSELGYIKKTIFSAEKCGGSCSAKKCAGCSHNPANKPPVVYWELCK